MAAPRRSVSLVRSTGSRYTFQGSSGNVLRGREGAVRVTGYLRGGPQVAAALARLEASVRDEVLQQATKAGGEVLADKWRDNVRALGLGPGIAHYAESIDVLAKPGKHGATAVVGLKEVPVEKGEAQPREYASRLEFGSAGWVLGDKAAIITYNLDPSKITVSKRRGGRRRVATPTLRPAFDAGKMRAADAVGVKVRELIERAI